VKIRFKYVNTAIMREIFPESEFEEGGVYEVTTLNDSHVAKRLSFLGFRHSVVHQEAAQPQPIDLTHPQE
jgi:hypothetical protein